MIQVQAHEGFSIFFLFCFFIKEHIYCLEKSNMFMFYISSPSKFKLLLLLHSNYSVLWSEMATMAEESMKRVLQENLEQILALLYKNLFNT